MNYYRTILIFTLIYIASNLFLILFSSSGILPLSIQEILLSTSGSFLISLFIYMLLYAGSLKGPKTRVLFTLAGIGIKFLLYLVLILISYFFFKILSLEFIVTFFVIYLAFTSFLMFSIFNLVRSKTIKQLNEPGGLD